MTSLISCMCGSKHHRSAIITAMDVTELALAMTVVRHSHTNNQSIDESLRELSYCIRGSRTSLAFDEMPVELVSPSYCKKLYDKLHKLCVNRDTRLKKLLAYLAPVTFDQIRRDSSSRDFYIPRIFNTLDVAFTIDGSINDLAASVSWVDATIKSILDLFIQCDAAEFIQYFITYVIERIYSLTRQVCPKTIVPSKYKAYIGDIKLTTLSFPDTKHNLEFFFRTYLGYIVYLQRNLAIEDHIRILSILVVFNNDNVINYYQNNVDFQWPR